MKGRILVVHRNELILDVIQEMLQNIGYAVTLATDGHRALGKAMSNHFHLVIVNQTLSGNLDGTQLVERMRKYGVQSPIIGTAPDSVWNETLETSADQVDYLLAAPFDYAELINAVESLLDKKRSGAPALPTLDEPPELPKLLEAPDEEILDITLSDLIKEQSETNEPSVPPPSATQLPFIKPEPSSTVPDQLPEMKLDGSIRILLVGSHDTVREQLVKELTEAGYEVTALKSGQEAYENCLFENYELILTDLWLTGMDGFELINELRKSEITSPIGVLPAHITRDMVEELLQFQVCKILLKPLKASDLLSLIQEQVV